MKKYFLFLLLLPLLTACGNDDVLDDSIDAAIEALEHNFDYEGAISELEGNHVGTINEPYSFAPIIDSDIWYSNDQSERVAAMQVPEDILRNLTTEALVTTCLRFNFEFDYGAYDNALFGMMTILNNEFNGYKELQKRPDAAYELLKKMRSMDPHTYAKAFDPESYDIYYPDKSILIFGFFSTMLASDFYPQVFQGKALNITLQLTKWWHHQMNKDKDIWGDGKYRFMFLLARIRLYQGGLSEGDKALLEKLLNSETNSPAAFSDSDFHRIQELTKID